MAPKTLRLAHPELCDVCAELLPVGTPVWVDPACRVSCSSCAGDLDGLVEPDPWSPIDDPRLRDALHHRRAAIQHRTLAYA